MNEEVRRAIIREVAELIGIPDPQRPYEFTRRQLQEQENCSYESAARALDGLVKQGILKKRVTLINSKRTNVYWRPQDEGNADVP